MFPVSLYVFSITYKLCPFLVWLGAVYVADCDAAFHAGEFLTHPFCLCPFRVFGLFASLCYLVLPVYFSGFSSSRFSGLFERFFPLPMPSVELCLSLDLFELFFWLPVQIVN